LGDNAVATAPYTIGSGGGNNPAWYNSGWTNRKPVTISHTHVSGSSNLTNFPVLVSVTDANLKTVANGGFVGKSDGSDILFTLSDGVSKLNHGLEPRRRRLLQYPSSGLGRVPFGHSAWRRRDFLRPVRVERVNSSIAIDLEAKNVK
jgi:hypothetical protein